MKRPVTSQEIWLFVFQQFGVKLPYAIESPSHSSPLLFLTEAFNNPNRDIAAWSCRSGGKTLVASILAAMEYMFTDNLQARVLSGSEDQAKNLYQYWANWCYNIPLLKNRLESDVKKGETIVKGGKIEILAASEKRVRGPKIQRLYEDELDEIHPDIDASAAGMMASRPNLPACTRYMSTWHRPNGLMAKLVNESATNGVSVHKWNVFDIIAGCPEERHENGVGCLSCPLKNVCVGKMQETKPDSNIGIASTHKCGLYQIDDVIKVYQKVGLQNWEAEYECKRPVVEGLVYPMFDAVIHGTDKVPDYLTYYRCIDWGYRDFVCLWVGMDKLENLYVLDTYKAQSGTVKQHAKFINAHKIKHVKDTFVDPAGRNKNDQTGKSSIQEIGEYGIKCRYTLSDRLRNVQNGIQMVRAMLQPATGPAKLHYLRTENNQTFVNDMQSYINRKVNDIYIDDPVKPQDADHITDSLRYLIVNIKRQQGVVVSRLSAH